MSFCYDDDDGNDAENGGVESLRLIMMKFDVFVSSRGDVTKFELLSGWLLGSICGSVGLGPMNNLKIF